MTIRVFNPDHDLALAANQKRFTAPHAGRKLRSDLSFFPALWSNDGDIVIVDDIDAAELSYKKIKCSRKPNVEFCTIEQLPAILKDYDAEINESVNGISEYADVSIDVWGWNSSIRFQLQSNGVPESLLPTDDELLLIRELSNRKFSSEILSKLHDTQCNILCGKSEYVSDVESFKSKILKYNNTCVIKAPWSCSGRGVRYLLGSSDTDNTFNNTMNWATNVIAQQGGIMIEPYYNKVKDFAVEFHLGKDGKVRPVGYSLFDTKNGAYIGNLLATEEEKREILSSYIEHSLLDDIVKTICQLTEPHLKTLSSSKADIHFGVDMMIVAKENAEGFLLHPCVEINFRRTMGLAALSLSPLNKENKSLMSISYESKKYHLVIRKKSEE